MKKYLLIALCIICFSCAATGCKEEKIPENIQNETVSNIPVGEFSYGKVIDACTAGAGNVQFSGFYNTKKSSVTDSLEAIEKAKLECTVEYDDFAVSYDSEEDMWCVAFYKGENSADDAEETVYLNGDGITKLIIYKNML